MDLSPTDEQQQLRDALRRLLDRRLAGLVEELPEPRPHDPGRALDDALAVGLTTLGLPEAAGGFGTFADLVVAHEELGRGLAAPLLTAVTLAGRLVLRVGGADAAMLSDIVAGRVTATPALDEDGSSSSLATVVAGEGDQVRVDGRKSGVVCGRDVGELLVSGRTETGAAVLVRVPVDTPGVEWADEQSACDVPSWQVTLRGVTVPAAGVMTGASEVAAYRTDATVLAAARQVGGGRAVLDRTIDHVKARVQFGRAIGSFQAVQHQLADAATDLDAASLSLAQAAWAVDADRPPTGTDRLAAIAALAAGDAFRRTTLIAHQLHGGMGFVLDSPLHLWSARAVADPTTPLSRRHLLDRLSVANGVTADAVTVPPDHRLAPSH